MNTDEPEEKTQAIVPLPNNSATMFQQAEVLIKSGMLPIHLQRPEQVVAIMLRGRELGIGPMEALTAINVISGKVTSSTQLMLALIYRSGQLEDIIMERSDPSKVTMKRRGMTPHTVAFGRTDAAAMGLLNRDTYKKFPEVIYLWRCIAMCARVVFPDIVGAVYSPDELGIEIQSDTETAEKEDLGFEQYKENEKQKAERLVKEKADSLKERALALMAENSNLTIPQLAKQLNVSPPEAKRLLNGE